MRQSPRRPLILKRRKLPFHQNEPAETRSRSAEPDPEPPSRSADALLDGVHVMDHPSLSDTQVVVVPKSADLQSVIGALSARGKESGANGPNKFILLNGNSGPFNEVPLQPAAAEGEQLHNTTADGLKTEATHNNTPDAQPAAGQRPSTKDPTCGPLDDSLTNIQWLGKMDTSVLKAEPPRSGSGKENLKPATVQRSGAGVDGVRPPYSYMAMIQFAINSRKNRLMTLKEIYTWIEDHFPYYRDVAKPGWKNSIRHNLSLHDMFIRETSPDGKVSLWTIRPEANRCLTLDQVYKPGCDPMTTPVPVPILVFPQPQMRVLSDVKKPPSVSERKIKPLLPRTDSYLVPIQLPVPASVFLPSPSPPVFSAPPAQQRRSAPREAKRVCIAPKVTPRDAPVVSPPPLRNVKVEVKEEPVDVPLGRATPKATPATRTSGSRRKQRLVRSLHEEPVLLCPSNAFFDSGVASDASMHRDAEQDESCPPEEPRQRGEEPRQRGEEPRQQADSPDREYCFKTPIKSSGHLTSSTPSKPSPSLVAEPWKVTPVRKGAQTVLDFSPIRTPGRLTLTPTLSFSSTPFRDWPLFNSPRELLTPAPPRVIAGGASPPQAPGASPNNRSVTEGLVLDAMNDSLSKILVDISFTGLEDDDLGMANISWSEFFPQLK